jgi:hypothetical protein
MGICIPAWNKRFKKIARANPGGLTLATHLIRASAIFQEEDASKVRIDMCGKRLSREYSHPSCILVLNGRLPDNAPQQRLRHSRFGGLLGDNFHGHCGRS